MKDLSQCLQSFQTMSADNLQLLDKCGAVRSSLNSWAIATWAENSVVKTMENLQSQWNVLIN